MKNKHGGRLTITLGHKNVYVFISFERGQSFCMRCVRDGQRRMDRDGGRRRQTAILTNNFFSWPYHTVLFSRSDVFSSDKTYSTGPRQEATCPPLQLRFSICQAEIDRLRLPVSRVGICIHHFITHTHFRSTTWLILLFLICASCTENLWLTARSRVNMQNK